MYGPYDLKAIVLIYEISVQHWVALSCRMHINSIGNGTTSNWLKKRPRDMGFSWGLAYSRESSVAAGWAGKPQLLANSVQFI